MTASNPDGTYWVRLRLGVAGDYVEYNVDSTAPVDPLDPVQVIDDLRIGWAAPTSEPWPAQPGPMTCSFGLYTTDVANVAAYASVGTPVEVVVYDGDPGAGGSRWLTFAGRVVNATASPFKRGTYQATVFRISCLDYLVDLAELVCEFPAFPVEDMGDRLTRIDEAIQAAGGTSIDLGGPLPNPQMDATTASTTDALSVLNDHLRQLNLAQYGRYERYYVRPDYTLGSMAPATFSVVPHRSYVDPTILPGRYVIEDNLISNPGFETNTSGWTATGAGAALTRVTSATADTGQAQGRFTGGAASAGAAFGVGTGIPVAPGTSYTFRMKQKAATTARNFTVTIQWYTAALAFISQNTSAAKASNTATWTENSVTASAPVNAAFAVAWINSTSAAGDVQNIDSAVFTAGTPVLGLDFPGSFDGDLSHGLVDGCQVDLKAAQWTSRKRTSPTRVTTTGPLGTFTAEHSTTDPIKLELSNTLTSNFPVPWPLNMAKMYLPELEGVRAWEVSKFVAYAGPLVDGLGEPGGYIREWWPDHATHASLAHWPDLPVVITDVPDAINLAGPIGRYAGQLTSAELAIIKRKFLVEFSLAYRLPTGPAYNDLDAASYDYVESRFPIVAYDHVDPDLTYYDARLARRY